MVAFSNFAKFETEKVSSNLKMVFRFHFLCLFNFSGILMKTQ